jgi:16S rRNA (guanine(527)-N(7))-methyltransferase RsmG
MAWRRPARDSLLARGPGRPGPGRCCRTVESVSQGPPSRRQRALIERHLDELDRWTRRLNLTSVPRDRAWDRHVGETVALLDAADLAEGCRCADLGSGGGIPGVIVAVLRPDVSITLVESDRRKAGFLVHVCGLLELANVSVMARRAEELGADPLHHQAYDVVVSRAAAPPPLLWRLSAPLLRQGGTLWALVSDADARSTIAALDGVTGVRSWSPAAGVLAVRREAPG